MKKLIFILSIILYKSVALASSIEIISPIEGSSHSLTCSSGYTLLDEVCVSNKSISASTPEELSEAIQRHRAFELKKIKHRESLNSLTPSISIFIPVYQTYVKKVEKDTVTLHNGGIVKIKTQDHNKFFSRSSFFEQKKGILFKEVFDWYLLIKDYGYKLYQVDLLEIPAQVPQNIRTIKEFVELLENN